MKKIIAGALTCLLVLASCTSESTSESTPETPQQTVLLKKVIATYNNGQSITFNYTYNGSKLDKITATDGSVDKYSYEGDLIKKVEFFNPDGSPNSTESYLYNTDNKLIKKINYSYDVNATQETSYIYNNDGTVTSELPYSAQTIRREKMTFLNGEVVSLQEYSHLDGTPSFSWNYSYDNGNKPTKGIRGFDKIFFKSLSLKGCNRNLVSAVRTDGVNSIQNEYTYYPDGFAKTQKETYNSTVTNYQYFYE